jgi:hypothetical protein
MPIIHGQMCVVVGQHARSLLKSGKEGKHVLDGQSAIGLGRLTYGRHEREGHGAVLHD